jgi:uncharacterized protein (TIRG00374 family)
MSDVTPSTDSIPSKRVFFVRYLLSLLPLGIFVWILRKIDLPLFPSAEALHHTNSLWLTFYGILIFVTLVVRGGRWRFLVQAFAPINPRVSFDITSIANAALILLPMRTGEFVRPLLARRRGISPVAAFSSIAAERIIDGFAVGLIVFVSLSLAPGHPQGLELLPTQFRDPGLVNRAARFALLGFSGALVGIFLFYVKQDLMQRLFEATLGKVSLRLAEKICQILRKIASGLAFLTDVKSASIYLGLTVLFWGLHLVGLHLLLAASGFENIHFIESCAVLGVFALGFLLPSPPGFFGAFQTTFYAGLLLYYPPQQVTNAGACAVFFAYAIQMTETLALGVFCYLREYVFSRESVPQINP